MKNRRLALVAALSIVELWIVGMMIRSVEAHFSVGSPAEAATADRISKTLETGPEPHVVIDDPDAALRIRVRAGTAVQISEQTRCSGWVHQSRRLLRFEKTADGVRIAPPTDGFRVSMSRARRSLDVIVPPGAHVEVKNAGTTSISGLRGATSIHTDDGSIAVSDQRGDVDAKTGNGRIELSDVEAPTVAVESDNGRIALDRVRSGIVSIVTANGRIEVGRSLLGSGKIQSDSGPIRLGLDPQSNVTVSAHTSSANVTAEAPLTAIEGADDDAPSTIRVGSGRGHLDVGSDDGSITVLAGRV